MFNDDELRAKIYLGREAAQLAYQAILDHTDLTLRAYEALESSYPEKLKEYVNQALIRSNKQLDVTLIDWKVLSSLFNIKEIL